MILKIIARILLTVLISLSLVSPAFAFHNRDHRAQDIATKAADRLEEARENFSEARENFLRHRGRLRDASPAARRDALEKAKQFLLKAIDRAIARIQKIIDRVDNSPVITAERKTELVSQLQGQIDVLNGVKAQIQAAQNGEQLRAAVKDGRAKFSSMRQIVKKVVDAILASHLDKVIDKLTSAAGKLSGQIDELEGAGVNTTRFEADLTRAKELLDQARNKNTSGNYRESRRLAEQARAILAKLHGQLNAARAKIKKEATGSATPSAQ